MATLSTVVSSFEVLLDQIQNSPSSASVQAKPTVSEVFPRSFQVPGQEDTELPIPVPSAVQGYFLLISNLLNNPVKLRITFNTVSLEGAQALAQKIPEGYAFLAITNTQAPTTSGTNIPGIYFSGLIPSGNTAFIDLPTPLPASGTFLFTLVPNYLSSGLVQSEAAGRGYVTITADNAVDLVVSPQTRTVFYSPTTSGIGETAYGLPTAFGGGSRITISG